MNRYARSAINILAIISVLWVLFNFPLTMFLLSVSIYCLVGALLNCVILADKRPKVAAKLVSQTKCW